MTPVRTREHYRFACRLGVFEIALNHAKAPQTCRYFKEVFESKAFNDASVFRIVTPSNSSINAASPIKVIQFGQARAETDDFDQLDHESTKITGLTHVRWAVSAARFARGQAYPSCFICMRDEPDLDHGGQRHPDEQGFAVFGRVARGFDVLDAIFAKAEPNDFLSHPIAIQRV